MLSLHSYSGYSAANHRFTQTFGKLKDCHRLALTNVGVIGPQIANTCDKSVTNLVYRLLLPKDQTSHTMTVDQGLFQSEENKMHESNSMKSNGKC